MPSPTATTPEKRNSGDFINSIINLLESSLKTRGLGYDFSTVNENLHTTHEISAKISLTPVTMLSMYVVPKEGWNSKFHINFAHYLLT